MLEQAEELTAEEDAYITDKDMTWAYVVSHGRHTGRLFAIQLDEMEHEPI